MTTVLEEVTDENISAGYVHRRVEDWVERINDFYSMISEWLPEGWSAHGGPSVKMHAPLMRKFNMKARMIPTLKLIHESGTTVWFAPHALWIVGLNGGIDMIWEKNLFVIVDDSENFETPNWQVSRSFGQLDRVEVTKNWLQQSLP